MTTSRQLLRPYVVRERMWELFASTIKLGFRLGQVPNTAATKAGKHYRDRRTWAARPGNCWDWTRSEIQKGSITRLWTSGRSKSGWINQSLQNVKITLIAFSYSYPLHVYFIQKKSYYSIAFCKTKNIIANIALVSHVSFLFGKATLLMNLL